MPGADGPSSSEAPCRCHHCGGDEPATATPSADSALRCACGSLLARFLDGKLELKCRRCKRTVMVALDHEAGSTAG